MARQNSDPGKRLRHVVVDLMRGQKRPMHTAEIASLLPSYRRRTLSQTLEDLAFDGVLILGAGKRYRLAPDALSSGAYLEGALSAHPRGFGFVRASDGDDVFIPADAMAGAMHRDVVRARVVARSQRGREGVVMDILSRGTQRVAGLLRGKPGALWLDPDDARVRGPIEVTRTDAAANEAIGSAAVVNITRYPEDSRENPLAELVALLGKPGEPDVEVAKLLMAHGIDEAHEDAAVAEAAAFGPGKLAAEIEQREDLRDVPFLTVDPHDARDHDDAICVTRDDSGFYTAWIAIADVSWFVQPGTALDEQAGKRGFSVYLPDRAIAMLPSQLSSGACSLSPDCDRLCMCLKVELDPTGKPRSWRLIEGAMRARAFLSYKGVARTLGFSQQGDRDLSAENHRHALRVAWDLAMLLRRRRMQRGALDLDLPEAAIVVDRTTRDPVAIEKRAGDPGVRKAYRLVEEMMLLANECVAQEFEKRGRTAVYRVHGAPDPEKLNRFAALCLQLDIPFDPEMADSPKKLGKLLRDTAHHPRATVLHGVLLRALRQAAYDVVNIGHFGLASSAYLHFTSPIRRYTDLLVHREVKRMLANQPGAEEQSLKEDALRISQQERRLMEATRAIDDLYRALYMRDHIGETFVGTISAITPTGLYVLIDAPFVSVMVPYEAVGRDGYEPDEMQLAAIGQRSGERLELGDSIEVIIEDVAMSRRTILGRRVIGLSESFETHEPRRGRKQAAVRKEERRTRASRSTAVGKPGARKSKPGKGRQRSAKASAKAKAKRKNKKRR